MDNADIANHLGAIASTRTGYSARAYRRAAVLIAGLETEVAALSVTELSQLDGIGAKISAAIVEYVSSQRDAVALALELVTKVESGDVPYEHRAELARILGDYLDRAPESIRPRIARAIVRLQHTETRLAIQWLSMATAYHLASEESRDQYEQWAEAIACMSGAYMAPAVALNLSTQHTKIAHMLAEWAAANPESVGWPPATERQPPTRLRTVNGRVWGVVDGGRR